ncbi:prephenate dehydratase [Chungangia koreensis]|uniref:Prephenate dehydratase n=1 Tax=Chungangia koreensis TaxID=752657 RepID=A0ABV8X751_9LACT
MVEKKWETRVGYLGPEASFTNIAAKNFFKDGWLLPYATIPECIEAVSLGELEYAVVPLENTLEGTVTLTIDYLFHEADLSVNAEILSPIEQHLMVHPANAEDWEEIKDVYSHPHALAQCYKYLFYRGIRQHQYASTAAAAKFVSENKELQIASIGNRLSAKKYGLVVVQENIHDFHKNHTRFLVLSKDKKILDHEGSSKTPKTTFMLTLPVDDRSGALHQVLSVFAWRRLNLTKIESRPLKTGLGNYFFVLDVMEDESHPMMNGAVEELQALGCKVKSLGTYYTHQTPSSPN